MDNKIIDTEYQVVIDRTLDIIATEIKTIDNHVCQVALNGAIEIGRRLEEAKEKVGHGNWENWCKQNLNYTASWAAKLMKISSEYGNENSLYLSAISKTDTCADFSISKAFRLLQVPENEVESFAENNNIDDMKVKDLEAEIKKLKQDKEEATEKLAETVAAQWKAEGDSKGYQKSVKELEEKLKNTQSEKDATYKSLQELQEQQLTANNGELSEEAKPEILERQKEIEKLQSDLEKWKDKEKKYKAEKELFEEEKLKAVQEAEAKAKEEAVQEAQAEVADTIERISTEKETAFEKVATLERQIASLDSDGAAERKVKMQFIKSTVGDIVIGIGSMKEHEKAAEAKDKLKRFLIVVSESI